MAMITLLAPPLIELVIKKVVEELSGELRLHRGVHGDMERLQSILLTIKDVLDDAEKKAIGEKAVCSWLKKLKDATYDADDVVDTFCTEALRQKIEYHDHFKRQRLAELPGDIRKMKNLRHLDKYMCAKLSGMPMGIGQLTNLETLPVFIVGEEEGQHITELQHLNQIRNRLCIKNLQKVTKSIDAREANLGAKTRVKSLCLEWGDERRADVAVEEEVIASLVPPPNLESLELRNYLGINYPSNWMIMSSYNSVERIVLVGLRRCAYLPPLGQLPSLKILEISGMDAIRRIGEEFYGEASGDKVPFHKLEELYMRDMKNLEEWVVEAAAGAGPGDIRRRDVVTFPCLTKLEIVDCPKLKRGRWCRLQEVCQE